VAGRHWLPGWKWHYFQFPRIGIPILEIIGTLHKCSCMVVVDSDDQLFLLCP
jgi:hypothetical protein